MKRERRLYGLLAEFAQPEDLLTAATAARAAGYRRMDAYTPFPVHGLSEAIGFHHTRLPVIVLIGGIVGACLGFGMQHWYETTHYMMNVGGRPHNSWPSFIVITFETTILCAALSAVLGMLALNGLPQPYHPLFNVPSFELASRSHFFLCIEARDPKFDLGATRGFLEALGPMSIAAVPTGRVKPPRPGQGARPYPAGQRLTEADAAGAIVTTTTTTTP
jgi:hypothetical protein